MIVHNRLKTKSNIRLKNTVIVPGIFLLSELITAGHHLSDL
jgi:hypothetical protein